MENFRRGCTISSLPFTLATLILLILKLCGVMTYSWWWVIAPLFVVPALLFVWFLAIVLLYLITFIIRLFD